MEALVLRPSTDRPLMTLLATWAVSLLLIKSRSGDHRHAELEYSTSLSMSPGGLPLHGRFHHDLEQALCHRRRGRRLRRVVWSCCRTRTFGYERRASPEPRHGGGSGISTLRLTDRMAVALARVLRGLRRGGAWPPLYNVNSEHGGGFIHLTTKAVDQFSWSLVLGGVGQAFRAPSSAFARDRTDQRDQWRPLYGAGWRRRCGAAARHRLHPVRPERPFRHRRVTPLMTGSPLFPPRRRHACGPDHCPCQFLRRAAGGLELRHLALSGQHHWPDSRPRAAGHRPRPRLGLAGVLSLRPRALLRAGRAISSPCTC